MIMTFVSTRNTLPAPLFLLLPPPDLPVCQWIVSNNPGSYLTAVQMVASILQGHDHIVRHVGECQGPSWLRWDERDEREERCER